MSRDDRHHNKSKLRDQEPIEPEDSYAWQKTQDAEACDKLLKLLREHHGGKRADKVEEIVQ